MRIRKRKSNGKKEITLYCYVRSYAFAYLLIDTEKRSRFLPVSCREPFSSDHMKKCRCTSSLSLLQFMKSIPYRFTLCISPSEIYVFSNAVTLSINLDVPIYECRVTKVDQHKIAVFVTKSDFLEKKKNKAASSNWADLLISAVSVQWMTPRCSATVKPVNILYIVIMTTSWLRLTTV